MSTSTLHVAGLLLVSSDDVPLHAEYALFDAGDIELRASGPGTVREAGYQTTALKARDRLAAQGIDGRLVTAVEDALRDGTAEAYARGDAVRGVVREMSAGEMLEGGVWLAEEQAYRGTWLRMDDLARDLDLVQAPLALQAVALASTLNDLADDAPIVLSTLGYTRDRRPGERTHRRVALEHATELPAAIGGLQTPAPRSGENGPSKPDVLEAMRRHAEIFASSAAKERLIRFERNLAERQMPTRGPLSDSSLWKIEILLAQGTTEGVLETLDTLEKMRGRSPSTTYLRARASFLTGQQDPRTIAERVGALALSMHNAFPELELLAAEAWSAAGDGKRAMPYARDLLANPSVHGDLRSRAERILRRSDATRQPSLRPSTLPPRARSTGPSPEASPTHSQGPSQGSVGDERTVPAAYARRSSLPPALGGSTPAERSSSMPAAAPVPPSPPIVPPPPVPIFAAPSSPDDDEDSDGEDSLHLDLEALPRAGESAGPPPREINEPRVSRPLPPAVSRPTRGFPAPSRTGSLSSLLSLDTPDPPHPPHHVAPSTAPGRSARPSQPPPASNRERRPSADPRAEPESSAKLAHLDELLGEDIVELKVGEVAPPPRVPTHRPGRNEPAMPAQDRASNTPNRRTSDPSLRFEFMRGSSQPSFRANPPAVPANASPFAHAPTFPRTDPAITELAADLPLPYGLNDQRWSGDGAPRSVLEARIHFTHLARQLGIIYRQQYDIELVADVTGIEAMQRHLVDRFASHLVRTPEEAEEVRKHGALLSEILIRKLGAEWADLSSTELGYWAMIAPPDTRIWPFGRVLRFISLGHKERDLVSYFLELQTRMRAE